MEIDNDSINLEIQYPSDHIPLTVNIVLIEEFIQDKQYTIIKNSKKEEKFTSNLIIAISVICKPTHPEITSLQCVVATTCQNGTYDMLTSAKLLVGCHKLHLACISTTSGPIFTN